MRIEETLPLCVPLKAHLEGDTKSTLWEAVIVSQKSRFFRFNSLLKVSAVAILFLVGGRTYYLHGQAARLLSSRDLASPISAIELSPDGRFFLSRQKDDSVRLWATQTATILHTWFKGVDAEYPVPAFSPSDRLMVTIPKSGRQINLRDSATQKVILHLRSPQKFYSNSFIFSPNSRFLAVMNYDQTIQVWDITTGKIMYRGAAIAPQRSRSLEFIFSHDSKWIATSALGGTIEVWDVATGKVRWTLKGHTSPVRSVAFSADSTLLSSVSLDFGDTLEREASIRLWDLRTGKSKRTIKWPISKYSEDAMLQSITLAFVTHDSALAVYCSNGEFATWDIATGRLKWKEDANPLTLKCAVSQDGQRWFTLSQDAILEPRSAILALHDTDKQHSLYAINTMYPLHSSVDYSTGVIAYGYGEFYAFACSRDTKTMVIAGAKNPKFKKIPPVIQVWKLP